MAEEKKIGVKFTQHYGIYFSGDQAGFVEDEAKNLVALGVADFHDPLARPKEEPKSDDGRTPATLEELVAEVKAAGYTDEAAAKTGQERFDGVYGEEARFLGAEVEYDEDDDEELTPEELRADLNSKTKDQLVAFAKDELNLELNASLKKDELVEAIVAEFAKDGGE